MPANRIRTCLLATAMILGLAACQGGGHAAAAGAAAAKPPQASADAPTTAKTDAAFLKAIHFVASPNMAKHSDTQLLNTGSMVCNAMRAGTNPEVELRALLDSGWSLEDASAIENQAVALRYGLCPDQYPTYRKWLDQGLNKG